MAELVTDMKIDVEAARALTYETSRICDLENNNLRVLESGRPAGQGRAETAQAAVSGTLKRLNGMLTPMSKYYCSEMCVPRGQRRDPGAGRLRLHEGLPGRTLPPRRADHHDL